MRMFAAIQALFAAAFLVAGLVALFGVGLTGLFFLLPGAAFAAVAAVAQRGSRAGILLALVVDAAVAAVALSRLLASPQPAPFPPPGLLDVVLPAMALTLVGLGVASLLKDWRALRAAAWM